MRSLNLLVCILICFALNACKDSGGGSGDGPGSSGDNKSNALTRDFANQGAGTVTTTSYQISSYSPSENLIISLAISNEDEIKTQLDSEEISLNTVSEKFKMSPLMFVSYFGPVEKVQLLLERGVDVNLKNQSGMTAIFFAAQAKQSAIVNLLLNAGADLNIKDDLGLSAIDYTHFTSREVASLIRSKSANLLSALEIFLEAIRSGDLNFLKANLFDSVSVEEAQKYAYPLFSEAIHFKKHEILLALFAYYKTADFLDQGKNTLLHFAIEQENIKAIRFLIEKGINPNQKNDLELSSLDIALSQNNEAIWIALSPQNRFFKIHNGNDLNGAKNATEFCESKNLTCNDASIDSNAILSGTYFWSHNECKNYNAFPGFCHPEMRFGGYWQDRSCSNTDLAQNSISNVPKIIACNTASEGKTLYPFLIQAEPDAKGAQTAKAFCAAQDLSCHSVLWEKISDSSLQLSECSKTITLEDQSEIEIDGAQIINLNFLKSKRIIYCE